MERVGVVHDACSTLAAAESSLAYGEGNRGSLISPPAVTTAWLTIPFLSVTNSIGTCMDSIRNFVSDNGTISLGG